MGFIAALPYIAMALKTGADMYGQHKEGKALEEAKERQEDEQRRLDAIAMFTKRPPGQAGFKYEMPRSARIANVVGSLADLGGQVAMMKAGGGGGGGGAGGSSRLGGSVANPASLQKAADHYTSGFGRSPARQPLIQRWRPTYTR
jgi:hypothetical protein|tara:strand:+ start:347 stop:781 length:435 start_codon:yes stop_codon:yes gene_type:complete